MQGDDKIPDQDLIGGLYRPRLGGVISAELVVNGVLQCAEGKKSRKNALSLKAYKKRMS